MYLWWFDDTPKKALDRKIADAHAAYRERFGVRGTVTLVNPEEGAALGETCDGLAVRRESYIRKDNVWIGREERAS